MTHFLEGRRGRCRPDEGFGMAIVMRDVVFDGANEFGHAPKGAPATALAGDLGEPARDQIEHDPLVGTKWR